MHLLSYSVDVFFSSSSVSVEISFCRCETFVAVNTSSIFESDECDLMAPHGGRLAVTLAASVLFILKSQLCTRQKLFQFFFSLLMFCPDGDGLVVV